jgi:hypothetical protein
MAGAKWMTYAELGEMIRGTPEAGRQLALRLKLRKQVGNEDKRVRVWVDEDAIGRRNTRPTPVQTPAERPVQTPVQQDGQTGEIKALREHLETVERLMAQQRNDHAAELERLREELERARMDADRARELAERERNHVTTMSDQVKDLADRLDRLHREHRAELEQARQPWWHRLIGR